MMRMAICDDVAADRRAIASALDAYLKARGVSALVEQFARPAALLAAAERAPFDLYLLDVLLDDELTGIDLVRRLRAGTAFPPSREGGEDSASDVVQSCLAGRHPVPVIFFSTSREYAIDAFAVEAISYLQKPWDKAAFARVLDLAMERFRARQRSLLTFRIGTGVARFSASEIESVVTARTVNYITIRCADDHTVTLRGSVRSFAGQYQGQIRLVPAGRSILVNPAQVARIEESSVRFFSGRTLTVPHSALAPLAKEILALSVP